MWQNDKIIQKCLNLIILEKKTQKNIIQIGQKSCDSYRSSVQNINIGGSESGKTNALVNLMNRKLYFDKTYLYAEDPYEAKYQFLITKPKDADLKLCNDSKAFIEYSNDMTDTYENIEEYNPNKECKILIIWLLIYLVIKNLILCNLLFILHNLILLY